MGAFVWPCPLKYEDALLNAGVSLVSDNMDPTLFEKPDGSPRWPRPGSQPLDVEWGRRIDAANSEERGMLSQRQHLPSRCGTRWKSVGKWGFWRSRATGCCGLGIRRGGLNTPKEAYPGAVLGLLDIEGPVLGIAFSQSSLLCGWSFAMYFGL